jgi:hypothetical protein
MKNLYAIIIFMVSIVSCESGKPSAFTAFSTEAGVFDIGDSWEINASTRVKGFEQTEKENRFTATIAYDVDLLTPAGDTIKSLISRVEDKEENERMTDIALEAQFELDSTYAEGKYKIIFNIKDVATNNTVETSAEFSLSKE